MPVGFVLEAFARDDPLQLLERQIPQMRLDGVKVFESPGPQRQAQSETAYGVSSEFFSTASPFISPT